MLIGSTCEGIRCLEVGLTSNCYEVLILGVLRGVEGGLSYYFHVIF